jgi:SAM-dependent methyltransferase
VVTADRARSFGAVAAEYAEYRPGYPAAAVLIGQAWHWFDLDRALPELARVLRPGGVLAALWNADDRTVQ